MCPGLCLVRAGAPTLQSRPWVVVIGFVCAPPLHSAPGAPAFLRSRCTARLALTPGQLETYRDVALKGISTKETRAAAVKADAVVLTRSSVPDKVPKVPQRIVKHLYTELRKAANHPLLLRRLYAESDSVRAPLGLRARARHRGLPSLSFSLSLSLSLSLSHTHTHTH